MNLQKQSSKWFNKKVFVWSLFDFANSSFAVIIVAFVYAVYFKKVVASNVPIADFYWSLGIIISMLISAFMSPVLGAASDYFRNKKKYLQTFTILCIIFTALLYLVQSDMIFLGLLLFIIANIGFQTGLSFYDAFIKDISLPENYNKVSSVGYATGYIGSLFSLAVIMFLKDEPRLTFLACSVIFLLFSLPLFIVLQNSRDRICVCPIGLDNRMGTQYIFNREKKIERLDNQGYKFIKIGFQRVSNTLKHIKEYRELKIFLLSYFLYIDGINTVIFFAGNYAQTTLGFTISELVVFYVLVQISAFAGSIIFGYIADWIGKKQAISLILLCWIIITIAVYFIYEKNLFFIIGIFGGLFLGSAQALSRSLMSELVPDEKKTELFGFYGLFEKTSTILGPFLFGLISWLTSEQRYAVLSMLIFFISGYVLLRKIKN